MCCDILGKMTYLIPSCGKTKGGPKLLACSVGTHIPQSIGYIILTFAGPKFKLIKLLLCKFLHENKFIHNLK